MDSDEEMQMDSDSDQEEVMEDQILTQESLEEEMKDAIADVQAVLQVKPGVCRILLHKFNWNKESLLERFYENPDTTTFLVNAQVIPAHTQTIPAGEAECDICCSMSKLTGLACNHRACSDCWRTYLTEKIVVARQGEIECMDLKCKLLVDDEKVLFYISDPAVVDAYRRLTINSYVEANKLLKWCPGVDCGKAARVGQCEARLVACTCGSRFCFCCGNDWHDPISCRLLKLWIKKCNDDSETFNWIKANTKECPKCFVTIEKNGGCNHMSCRNSSCRFEFCWMCMNSWKDHGAEGYTCNRYEDSQKSDTTRNKSRASLDRYLFYYNRYIGHEQSLKLEEKLVNTVDEKMETMQTLGMSWVEVQYLKKSVDVLSECRRTLMFTYAFAFYLESNNSSFIFEANQKDLEMATEELSGFLERDLENVDLLTLKQKVQDKSRYVAQRRKVLLDHCAEGTEQDIWVFSV